MAKFSVGREEDDSEGPSRRRPKRRRTTRCYQSQPQRQENPTLDQQEEEEEEVEVVPECDEQGEEQDTSLNSGEEQDEEEGESERAEELVEEEEGGGEEEESSGANLGRQSIGDRGDGSISVTLTDPDVLDCPICLEPLNSPVFQCENGHIACSSCCIKVGNKCPSCSWPIGYNRCRAIEKVIESVKISCINIKYGCNESVTYNKKHDHEEMCIYVPCSCPLSGCNFIGSSKDLFQHFTVNHLNSAKRFDYNSLLPLELGLGQRHLILQEQTDRTTFVLNHAVELLGSVVNVICIAPSSTKIRYAYDLIARNEDTSVRLQSFTQCIPQLDKHHPLNMFLLVPSNFHGARGKLKLELCIRRPSDVHAPVVRGNCVV